MDYEGEWWLLRERERGLVCRGASPRACLARAEVLGVHFSPDTWAVPLPDDIVRDLPRCYLQRALTRNEAAAVEVWQVVGRHPPRAGLWQRAWAFFMVPAVRKLGRLRTVLLQ